MAQIKQTTGVVETELANWIVPGHSIFGRNLSKKRVEMDVLDYLKEWLPSYISEQEQQEELGRGFYPEIVSWTRTNQDIEKFPEDSLPAVVVVSPGMAEEPKKDGRGIYRVKWTIILGIIFSGNDYESTMDGASDITAAARLCMLQGQTLNKSVGYGYRGVDLIAERFDDSPPLAGGMNRTVGVGSLLFTVDSANVVSVNAGPTQEHPFPDHDTPYPPAEPVDTVNIEVGAP